MGLTELWHWLVRESRARWGQRDLAAAGVPEPLGKKEAENPAPLATWLRPAPWSYSLLLLGLGPCTWALDSSSATQTPSECQSVPGLALAAGVSRKERVQPCSKWFRFWVLKSDHGFEHELQSPLASCVTWINYLHPVSLRPWVCTVGVIAVPRSEVVVRGSEVIIVRVAICCSLPNVSAFLSTALPHNTAMRYVWRSSPFYK